MNKYFFIIMGDELEQRLLDLQEEFQILQESTAEVERRQEARIADLERALHRLQHSNDGFIMEKLDLQVPSLILSCEL